jgi:7-cyano-7-deazaguanine synthase
LNLSYSTPIVADAGIEDFNEQAIASKNHSVSMFFTGEQNTVVVNMTLHEKCVVVLSGGPDSVTVAYWAKDQGYDVSGLTFKYGQLATNEIHYAEKTANTLQIPHQIIDLSALRNIFRGVTSLVDDTIAMTSTFSQPIIVPFRNGIFLSVAVAYAASIHATRIFYGAQRSDATFYPDCRPEFYHAFENTAQLGTDSPIVIDAPFSDIPKSEIITLGTQLGVPYQDTWSCYINQDKHCGQCESCRNRQNAFREANIRDPTEYLVTSNEPVH